MADNLARSRSNANWGRAPDVASIRLGMQTGLQNVFNLNLKCLPSPIRLWYNPFPEHTDMHVRALSVPGLQSVA